MKPNNRAITVSPLAIHAKLDLRDARSSRRKADASRHTHPGRPVKSAPNAEARKRCTKRYCPATGKVRMNSYPQAVIAKRTLSEHGLHIYRCPKCHSFHLGHGDIFRTSENRNDLGREFFAAHQADPETKEYRPKPTAEGEGWGWSFGTGLARHFWAEGAPMCGAEHTNRPSCYYPADAAQHDTDCVRCRLQMTVTAADLAAPAA